MGYVEAEAEADSRRRLSLLVGVQAHPGVPGGNRQDQGTSLSLGPL